MQKWPLIECLPKTAVDGKLHDEVEGASMIRAGSKQANHIRMVHLDHGIDGFLSNENPFHPKESDKRLLSAKEALLSLQLITPKLKM